MASDSAPIPSTMPVLGAELPVDMALTGRVAAQPATIAPSCAHTRQAIKRGEVFVVSHTDGTIYPGCECGQGIYYRDTRFLSGLKLALDGKAPIVLSASAEHNFFSRIEAMNEAWQHPGQPLVKRETIHIGRTRVIDGGVRERLEIRNFNAFAVQATLAIELRADFKDIFEIRSYFAKQRPGTFLMPLETPDGVELLYKGSDDAVRHLAIALGQKPDRLIPCTWGDTHETGVRVEWDLSLAPMGGCWETELTLKPMIDGVGKGDRPAEPLSLKRLEALHAKQEAGFTRVKSAHAGFEAFLNRGVADLLMLSSETSEGPFLTAGIPWYACPFGRDGILTAMQALPLGCEFARGALRFLARHQGQEVNDFNEEEPGKILHEMRMGELARLKEIPHTPYYGTIDATPLWLVLLSEAYRWSGDRALIEELWPNALRALDWIDAYGDVDGDGFVEYIRKFEKGLSNQGWKDSCDSIIHQDGTLAVAPIALVEVQGYVYDAKCRMAELAGVLGDQALQEKLETQAHALKRRFNEAFWNQEGGYYVIALDGHKNQVKSKTSNFGHALWSGIIEDSRVEEVAASLLAPDMFNGWGVRTMSAEMPTYNPMSYHNGSVWPHDTAIIAKGLADKGQRDKANRLLSALLETSCHFDYQRLPELLCGFEHSGRFAKPVPYPVACSPQAWAAGTPLMLLQAALGLAPDASAGVLRVEEPALPDWLPSITLTGLRVGEGRADLLFEQLRGRTRCTVLATEGRLRVEVVYAEPPVALARPQEG